MAYLWHMKLITALLVTLVACVEPTPRENQAYAFLKLVLPAEALSKCAISTDPRKIAYMDTATCRFPDGSTWWCKSPYDAKPSCEMLIAAPTPKTSQVPPTK